MHNTNSITNLQNISEKSNGNLDLPLVDRDGLKFVDSRTISEALGLEHKSFRELIEAHQEKMEGSFGPARFETTQGEVSRFQTAKPQNVGGRPEKYVLLTEDQALFVGTLSRNTDKVVEFKARLVQTFQRLRKSGEFISQQINSLKDDIAIDDELLSESDAARLLAITEGTLRSWRYHGKGPKTTNVGKLVRYSRSAIQEFIRLSNSGISSGSVRSESAEVRPSYSIADLAAEVISQFEKSLSDLTAQNAQDGQMVLAVIFRHRVLVNDGWVSVEEVVKLLTSDHVSKKADPAKRLSCEKMLKDIGIRLELDKSNNWTIWISNTLAAMARILAGSAWPKRWCAALKMIPCALHKDLMRFTGSPTAATGIPLSQTSICTGVVVPVNPSGVKPNDLVAPDRMDMISRIYKMSGNTRMTNTQLVCIVLHAISNAHLLRG